MRKLQKKTIDKIMNEKYHYLIDNWQYETAKSYYVRLFSIHTDRHSYARIGKYYPFNFKIY